MENLKDMISEHAYNEIKKKVEKLVGREANKYIFPAVEKALEKGSGRTRERILIDWLNLDSVRVCSKCGAIMEEGWYMGLLGYACSDECAAKMECITMEQFEKWRIYKSDIIEYMEMNGDKRNIEELTKEECDSIIEEYCEDCDYYWTEWY